jgi:small conductance mechanosensitive channel
VGEGNVKLKVEKKEWTMDRIIELLQTLAVTYGLKVLGSIAIFVIGRWLAKILVKTVRRLLQRAQVEQTLVSFLGNLLYYVLFAIVIVAALNNLGIPTTSIVAIFGATALAIGLALQDSIGNLSSGVLVILLRPYRAGDFVEVNDTLGYVTGIQLFHTELTTRDNKTVLVPNKDVLDSNIVNYSTTEWVRLDLVYGIGYGDDVLKAKRVLEELVNADERVAQDPPAAVVVKELGDSSVNLAVRPYVRVKDIMPVTFALTEQVKLRFDQEGVSIPFPQRDVHLFQAN